MPPLSSSPAPRLLDRDLPLVAAPVLEADTVDRLGRILPSVWPLDGKNSVLAQFSQTEVVHFTRAQTIEVRVIEHEACERGPVFLDQRERGTRDLVRCQPEAARQAAHERCLSRAQLPLEQQDVA